MDDDLIAAVYRREPLWNQSDKLHRNVNVLKSLWEEVAEETCKDVKTIKTRWKNLRAYYVKECQKLQKIKGLKREHYYSSPWQYFEPLKFLGTTFAADRLSNVVDDNTSDSNSTFNLEETYELFQEQAFPAIEMDPDPDDYPPTSPPRKKFRPEAMTDEQKDEMYLELERKKIEVLEQDVQRKSNDDLLFFESLLPYMKDIPIVRKLRLRSAIQELISKELEVQNGSEECCDKNDNV